MPSPLLFIAAPMLFAILAYTVRRWMRLTALGGAVVLGVLAIALSLVELDRTSTGTAGGIFGANQWTILGRDIVLDHIFDRRNGCRTCQGIASKSRRSQYPWIFL